jgi:prepilin-type processing-associated H-X9-DG protein
MPRFSITALLWLTAIVAIAAALPRGYVRVSYADGHVERYAVPIANEIAERAIVVLILILLVLAGHCLFRAKQLPPPLVWAIWFGTLIAAVATGFWLIIGSLEP